jgi:hypothetical protein
LSKVDLTDRQAHDLDVRLKAQPVMVLTCQWFGHSFTDRIRSAVDPHWLAVVPADVVAR